MIESWASLVDLMARFAEADDPEAAAGMAFDGAVADLVAKLRRFDAIRLIEVARLAMLPMAPEGTVPVVAEASAAQVELLTLVALAARREAAAAGTPFPDPVADQEMSRFVSEEAREDLDRLLRLAQIRAFAAVDRADKLALVTLLLRGAEVWMRNSSYPEMVEATNRELLDGDPNVRAALNAELGFDATDAIAVLEACHDLQEDGMNSRMDAMRNTILSAMAATQAGQPDGELKDLARSSFMSMFEPGADEVTVTVDDIAAHTGISGERVEAVVERFRLDLGSATPAQVVDAFTSGRNPMRTRPLVQTENGRLMLPHSALNVFAVRENLEDHLKTSVAWDSYAKHRGDLLESRTRTALGRVLPGAYYRDAFEYYVPANSAQEVAADPAGYTKRVEGDHLVILDDVAIIVEDKAVALSALSRAGRTARIRRDLTGIITNAAAQAGRMRNGIERDGGLQIEGEGWVGFRHIREIHTIAVSLDDLPTVLTATSELMQAGILSPENIPWTVSLHDLEVITELVDRPAEFLLYLRRRRNPDVTVMFSAPDELDLFLYFFEAGLWVEPDPAKVRSAFPFLPEPTTAELRRYRAQQPVFLSSRTDALDRWFHRASVGAGTAPKPVMVPSPVATLVDELQTRNVTGWLSIGATLLSTSTDVQHRFARHGGDLLNNPDPNGLGRSLTIPMTGSVDPAEGWLFVWATRPPRANPADTEKNLCGYLRAKKHQLGIPRGVVFLYDEQTRSLVGAFYDGHIGPLDATLTATVRSLRAASDLQRALHPNAKRPPHKASSIARTRQKRKR
ncbi:preprotein translocase subunit SecA [Kitasatospora sp. CM 4170]|uniref:Preprotein translocase subunit SecA n=1 Tax=Kitasatospora aburaviensis TaxID=67265 RepID=A0ABW1EY86_9ACTN|nr:preprotein translocase subunit SecA [Kitasatospora sp. CM 4170]WNM44301.1 preprotein translocase subunit SecA [Kitasatospora sp. CM 4170]